jgi:hypothetical protein
VPVLKDVTTPVPLVLLSVTLAGPVPSGSTGTSRPCQGCSLPPGTTRIRLPSTTPACCDRPAAKVSHHHSNRSASRRKKSPRQAHCAQVTGSRTRSIVIEWYASRSTAGNRSAVAHPWTPAASGPTRATSAPAGHSLIARDHRTPKESLVHRQAGRRRVRLPNRRVRAVPDVNLHVPSRVVIM